MLTYAKTLLLPHMYPLHFIAACIFDQQLAGCFSDDPPSSLSISSFPSAARQRRKYSLRNLGALLLGVPDVCHLRDVILESRPD
jgi:hypothetical protein